MPSVEEPQVTVRNIPQSQYESNAGVTAGPSMGGGIANSFRQHKWLWIGGGILGIIVLYVLWQYWNNTAGSGNATTNSAYGNSNTTSDGTPADLWGSQLDSDYQQLNANVNNGNGLLQQILNQLGGTVGSSTGSTFNPTYSGIGSSGSPIELPAGTKINYGAQGRVWYTTPGGVGMILEAPDSFLTQNQMNAYLPNSGYQVLPGPNGSWYWQTRGANPTTGVLVPSK